MTATVFDPKRAIHFAIVVREGSITAAARRIGVAQPWISEQIRQLEAQMGERLLVRTSRRMTLTAAGAAFLPYAEALLHANEAAQRYALEARRDADQMVRIGAPDFTIGLEERAQLIDHVLLHHPQMQLAIEGGRPLQLLNMLRAGDVDVTLLHRSNALDLERLDVLPLATRYAHLLVTREDPLADRDSVTLEDLAHRPLATSPGRSDAPARNEALAPLLTHGVTFVAAPDEDREAIARFAARQGIACFWYYRERRARHMRGGQVCIPIDGNPLATHMILLRRIDDRRASVNRFWSAVEILSARSGAPHAPAAER